MTRRATVIGASSLLAVVVAGAALLLAGPVQAQGSAREARLTSGPRPTAPARRAEDGGVVLRKATVRMSTDPGGIVVVRVPVPFEVRTPASSAKTAFYSVVTRGGVQLLGSASGPVTSGRELIPLSFNIGRRATAGVAEIAIVEFRSDSVTFEVPVELDVTRIGAIDLQLSDAELVAPQGRWSVLRIRVLNGGNADESVTLHVAPLPGWRFEAASAVSIAAGGLSESLIRLWVPPAATPGLTILRVTAQRGRDVVANGQARLIVKGSGEGRADGVNVALSTMAVSGLDRATATLGYSLSMSGQLTDSVSVDARATLGQSNDRGAVFALARSGMFTMPPSLTIRGSGFSASAGVLNAALMDPGGGSLAGLGGSGSLRLGQWRASAFGGVPFDRQSIGIGTGSGTLAGAGMERSALQGTVGMQALHLEDRQLRQGLESFTLHGSSLQVAGGTLDISVAARRLVDDTVGLVSGFAAAGSGAMRFDSRPTFGGSSSFRHVSQKSSFEFRVLHAPGGSQSFARSGTDVATSVSRQVSSALSISSSGWLQRDNNRLVGSVSSTGFFVSPALAAWRGRLRVALEGRGSDMSVTNGPLAYSSAEKLGGANTELRLGALLLRGRSLYGSTLRSVLVSEQATSPLNGMRQERQGTVGLVSGRGTLDATWTFSGISGAGSFMVPQRGLQIRLDDLRLLPSGSQWIVVNAEAQRISAMLRPGSTWMWHGDISVPLPGGLAVTASVDQNPYLRLATNGASAPLVYALRVDQRRQLGRLGSGSGRGRLLFVDDNGDGRRDGGEEPLSGVTLQCGAQAVTTDASGRFSCSETQATVDVRTLPLGIVPPSGMSATRRDIALHRVEPVSVMLTVSAIDAVRLSPSELAKAIVSANDGSGTRWYARQSSKATFVFDALPLGRYRLDVEQGSMSESIALASDTTALWVSRVRQAAPMAVGVRGRQTRIKVIGPSTSGGPGTSGAPAAPAGPTARDSLPSKTPIVPRTGRQ